jgi:ComF family protein
MVTILADLLFTRVCAACGAAAPGALCLPCAGTLVELGAACPRCAEPLPGPPSITCSRCRRAPLPLAAIVAPWRFGGAIADALRRLKFSSRTHVARTIAPLVAPYLAAVCRLAEIDVVVPVPLHWWRRTRRGFDQAALLAGAAARVDPGIARIRHPLRRARRTAPQTGLAAAARAANVAGAFTVPPRARRLVAGRRVVVFDDVVTTGATMAAAARALRAAGAAEVLGFAIARAES